MSEACQSNDRELWRETPGDYYADSIHVTERGGIGISCGGTVHVMTLRQWHKLAGGNMHDPLPKINPEWEKATGRMLLDENSFKPLVP